MMAGGSICQNCFHSYVCEQFNERKDDNNQKCHFSNDHFVNADSVIVLPCEEAESVFIKEKIKSNEPQKLFTPEEVRKMSPDEVRENYSAIMESMKKWRIEE